MIKLSIPFLISLILCGCASGPDVKQEPIVIKENPIKDQYIDKVEAVTAEATAGLIAVRDTMDKAGIAYTIINNQIIRLSGIKEPSVAKVEEYRRNISQNDTKAAAKDKVEAEKVDEQTSELYATVAILDSQLAEEQLRRAEADRIAERALKEQFRERLQKYGLYMTLGGILVMAFLKNFFKSGVIMCGGGVVLTFVAYWIDSPAVGWIMGVTAALVAIQVLAVFGKFVVEHLRRKNLLKGETG